MTPHPASPSSAPVAGATASALTVAQITGMIGMTLFVVTEIAAALGAAAWAVVGALGLAAPGAFVVYAIAAVPTVGLGWIVARLAYLAETDPDTMAG